VNTVLKLAGAVAALASVLALGLLGIGEIGEVVVLQTRDADGSARHTRLWIVEDAGQAWLRAGQASQWLENLRERPDVVLERAGEPQRYRAVVVDDPATRERVHALMAEKYGIPDRIIDAIRDYPASRAIRLDPAAP
jgi:hypothetical protein